jgi:hypothetical protein
MEPSYFLSAGLKVIARTDNLFSLPPTSLLNLILFNVAQIDQTTFRE